MNIPYYYNSGYADDGVSIYTCLNCGYSIYVRSQYTPKHCCECGIRYAGEKENIGNKNKHWYGVCFTERSYWTIEERTVEIWGEPSTVNNHWRTIGYYYYDENQDTKKILAEKRRYEEEDAEEIRRAEADHERIQNLRRRKDPNFDEEKAKNSKAFTSKKEFRIVRKKEIGRHSCMVRKDIYFQKTGKEFKPYEQDRLPYGLKEEITTGFKFLNMRTVNA